MRLRHPSASAVRSVAAVKHALERAVRAVPTMMEPLENRTMLTRIDGSGTMEYLDAEENVIRVAWHNVTAELVFADVDVDTNAVTLRRAAAAPDAEVGRDLFRIYVRNSDSSSYLSIAKVPDGKAAARPMQPFEGSIGNLRINEAFSGQLTEITAPENTGAVLIGARTRAIDGEEMGDNIPITSVSQATAVGLQPAPADGTLEPGITVANDNDFGRMLIGGAVTGQANFTGNLETFYAGWLITGDTAGQIEGNPTIRNNFRVNGDLRNLVVGGPVGTDLIGAGSTGINTYVTGFDLKVNGTLGQFRAAGDLTGAIDVDHGKNIDGFAKYKEVEDREFVILSETRFENGRLGDNIDHQNDTFDTAQFLGSIKRANGDSMIRVDGTLEANFLSNDSVDTYAVGFMSGQDVIIDLDDTSGSGDGGTGVLTFAIYDADGRLVHSSLNNGLSYDGKFKFTVDRPGVHYIEVGVGFVGADFDYTLKLFDTGDVGVGGIRVDGSIYNQTSFPSMVLRRGDLGAVEATGTMFFSQFQGFDDVRVNRGNFRSLEAGEIGLGANDDGFGVNLEVPRGGVGLIRTTGLMNIETLFTGGDMQTIDAGGTCFIELHANGSLGVLRAGDMATLNPSVIEVNADRSGPAGIIDLIDVTGDLGINGVGGPRIFTREGGNVRYMRVGGAVYRDRALAGGGEPSGTVYEEGEVAKITDDSGSIITITPTPSTMFDPDADPTDPDAVTSFTPRLYLVTYPIRGGGEAIIDLRSERSIQIDVNGQFAEIGRIEIRGEGTAVVEDADGVHLASEDIDDGFVDPFEPPVDDDDGDDDSGDGDDEEVVDPEPVDPTPLDDGTLELVINGSGQIDVLSVVVVEDNGLKLSNATRIQNNSKRGEIVNVVANSIGELFSTGTLGLARRSTAAPVNPTQVPNSALNLDVGPPRSLSDFRNNVVGIPIPKPAGGLDGFDYPFFDARNAIVANNIVSASANGGVGNFMIYRNVGSLEANVDRANNKKQFEGINEPIVISRPIPSVPNTGRLMSVNIGEGLLPSGTGAVGLSGIYTASDIGQVRNQGNGSDIRGDIISQSLIESIVLDGGSIINADIFIADAWLSGSEVEAGLTVPDVEDPVNNPRFDIGEITLNGRGGIIGATVAAGDIGRVTVNGGFGLFSSTFLTLGDGRQALVSVDNYGIRDSMFEGGSSLTGMEANGNGKRVSTAKFSKSVRLSENKKFDPYWGFQSDNIFTDLHTILGTSKKTPKKKVATNTGVIEGVRAVGQRDLGHVSAERIRGNSEFRYANEIGSFNIRDQVNNLDFSTGRLDRFSVGGNVRGLDGEVSGPVGNVNVRGRFDAASVFSAKGPDGTIDSFVIGKAMDGTVFAEHRVGRIDLKGKFTGEIEIDARLKAAAVRTINIDGMMEDGVIDVDGRINRLNIGGGMFGDNLITVDGNINQLIIRRTHTSGAIAVRGQIGDLIVKKGIGSGTTVDITQDLDLLDVGGDLETGAVVTIGGKLKRERIAGSKDGDLIVG